MINRYEMKNWGIPLDDKFFDIQLYSMKPIASRQKKHDKKQAKNQKKIQKRKVEEPTSENQSDIN